MALKAPDAMPVTEDIAERTQAMMGNYFSWLQNAMSASPWANMELNRKLMSYATESVSAYVERTPSDSAKPKKR